MRQNLPVTGRNKSFRHDANILSTTTPGGEIRYVNQCFVDIAEFPVEELIGQPHNIVRHPDMPSAAFKMLWAALKSGNTWKGIVKNRTKNGDHYWVDAFATPIMKEGKAVEFQSVRVAPAEEDVARAELLYKQLNAGKTPVFLKRKPISFNSKLMILFFLTTLISGVIANFLPGNSLLVMGAMNLIALSAGGVWLFLPFKAVIEKAKSISEDPVAMRVYTGRNDEAGQLMLAMKVLQSETSGIVGRIADDANNLVNSNSALISASEKNSAAVSQLYRETEAVAAAINEMSASINEVSSNTAVTADAVSCANKESVKSREAFDTAVSSIEAVAAEINAASVVIEELEKGSEAINSIVDVIRTVAEQTNLLALNAAIEAARAGDQGRGFAVVADEVRTLANRTHQSTEEITAMIDRIQSGTQKAVQSMGSAQLRVGESVDEVKSAAASMARIAQSMSEVSGMSIQVAAAVEQQSSVSEEINRNISSVMNAADEISQTASVTEKSCSEVNSLANQLSELAAQFWEKKV